METKTTKTKINQIKIGKKTSTIPKEIANEFNDFFSRIGGEVADSVSQTQSQPTDFLPETNYPELGFGPVSQGTICNIIKLIQSKSSTDINGISMRLLKSVAIEVGSPLAHIFNLSLQQGIFPDLRKQSKIVPVHKNGKTDDCDNYRPIALLTPYQKSYFTQ